MTYPDFSKILSSGCRRVRVVVMAVLTLITLSGAGWAQNSGDAPIDFSADAVSSDAETGVLIATGNVVLEQQSMRLTADRVEYDRNKGEAVATGSVIFIDREGNTHYADHLLLDGDFSTGFAEEVISRLQDGSWLSADRADFTDKSRKVFDRGRFTPCKCDFKGGATPAWEIRTSETIHVAEETKLVHKNVRMQIFSVPIMYFPYLSHPDWTVRRQTGLLQPRIAISSDVGLIYSQPYYIVTGDTHDLEITPYLFGTDGNAVNARYRRLWDKSDLNARITGGRLNTFKKSKEDVFGVDATLNTILGDHWKTHVRLYRASQDTFQRRYKFEDDEYLKSYITSERIDPFRYSRVEAYDIQDLRNNKGPEKEPVMLPSVFHERYLPTSRENLSLRLRLSAISLHNDDYTDIRRWSSEIYGYEEFLTGYGVFSSEGRLVGQYRDIETATGNSGYTGELGQASIAAGVGWSLPMTARVMDRFMFLEPKAKFVSIRSSDRTNKIPNRDSSDFRLDEANLFLLHRQQGEDFMISNSRVDLGVSVSLEDKILGNVDGFLGSSIRLSGKSPDGLNATNERDRISDILASIAIKPRKYLDFSLSGRFHPREFDLNETKTSASLSLGKTRVSATYNQLAKSYFSAASTEKEQLILTAEQQLPGNWRVKITQEYDLSNDTRKLKDSMVDFNYGGGIQDCLTVSIGYTRDTQSDRDIKPVDEIFLLFSFKYLGAISTSDLGRSN
ncbi:LPS-assembly protein LptD [Alphaproteobacteria bacterium LSUCC0684]